ncbi:unnamed protein product (macronuclear) [Paramecium tetraurelia]|uniref:4a-hydroxytetrahydrobiopterin dehydratase n=1 Tax=Paramecium tetraurelia TaxID=5888 RepID=A0CFY7_PARTE|nr:uncharacterized protein GSPATT00038146001 [Paramecium tetraurelia]CAK69704.1 unnamed protein product [Paramecium tetraurelia]|eukprot:XP_001437101.1 hypothetical protein (macronuclear) [Paramecium tetraurelia strain d4-2]
MIQLFRFCSGKITSSFPKLSFKVKDFSIFKGEKPTALKNDDIKTLLKMHQLGATWKLVLIISNIKQQDDNSLYKEVKFSNFKEAFSFMTQVAIFSEQINRNILLNVDHPEWENLFNTIKIRLITDDVNNITVKDVFLAYAIDNIAMNVQVKSAESTNDTRILEIAKIAEAWNFNFDQFHRMIETDSKQI